MTRIVAPEDRQRVLSKGLERVKTVDQLDRQGLGKRAIAVQLGVSVRTISRYMQFINRRRQIAIEAARFRYAPANLIRLDAIADHHTSKALDDNPNDFRYAKSATDAMAELGRQAGITSGTAMEGSGRITVVVIDAPVRMSEDGKLVFVKEEARQPMIVTGQQVIPQVLDKQEDEK